MSNIFVDFTDSMLETETVQHGPEIGQILFAATSRIISLAKAAAQEPSEDTRDRHNDNYLGHHTSQWQELTAAKADEGIPVESRVSGSNGVVPYIPRASWNPHLTNLMFSSSSVHSPTLAGPTIFSNGWFSWKPSFISRLPSKSIKQESREGAFAFKLIQITLSLAYSSLLQYHHDPTFFAMRMC
jgi:hypothetical protein